MSPVNLITIHLYRQVLLLNIAKLFQTIKNLNVFSCYGILMQESILKSGGIYAGVLS